MKKIELIAKQRAALFSAILLFVFCGALDFSIADDDDHEEESRYHKILDRDDDGEHQRHRRRRYRRRFSNGHEESYLKPVANPIYKDECGACHFAYQPGLLPEASWMKIVTNLDEHFEESVELEDDSKRAITDYLRSNSAERSSAEISVKIVRSLGRQVALRITDIPYIRKKHHEIPPYVFKRDSIESFSNCLACHPKAENGIYEDDDVHIPK